MEGLESHQQTACLDFLAIQAAIAFAAQQVAGPQRKLNVRLWQPGKLKRVSYKYMAFSDRRQEALRNYGGPGLIRTAKTARRTHVPEVSHNMTNPTHHRRGLSYPANELLTISEEKTLGTREHSRLLWAVLGYSAVLWYPSISRVPVDPGGARCVREFQRAPGLGL